MFGDSQCLLGRAHKQLQAFAEAVQNALRKKHLPSMCKTHLVVNPWLLIDFFAVLCPIRLHSQLLLSIRDSLSKLFQDELRALVGQALNDENQGVALSLGTSK